jgi:ATP synthase assembly factor FMC1, mitochondrial
MSSTSPSIRTIYRSFLRELPPRPILTSRSERPLHNHLRELMRTQNSAAMAQCVAYLRAQRTYAELLERYNPGLGMDEEDRIRLTARRVGMDMPVEYDAGEKKE